MHFADLPYPCRSLIGQTARIDKGPKATYLFHVLPNRMRQFLDINAPNREANYFGGVYGRVPSIG